jgi:hypothetical protein
VVRALTAASLLLALLGVPTVSAAAIPGGGHTAEAADKPGKPAKPGKPTPTPTTVAQPPAGSITIEKLKVNGTGCRSDTTAVAISPDREAFTVTYREFLAQAGGETKRRDETRACSITVRLNVPSGITYGVAQADYRGFASLAAGASATHAARYKFQGQGAPVWTEHAFPGGLDDSWQVTDVVSGGVVHGSCKGDRKLDIDTELRVRAGSGAAEPVSFIVMDSTDAVFSSTYRLQWQACPK